MFHEYRDEVTALKTSNAHFAKIFDEHNELDDRIQKNRKWRRIDERYGSRSFEKTKTSP